MIKKQGLIILLLLLVCAAILVFPLLTNHESEFGGADGAAEELITQLNPDYEPWAESLIELPGGETESLLFCLQAALGGMVLGGGFGYLVARKRYRKDRPFLFLIILHRQTLCHPCFSGG